MADEASQSTADVEASAPCVRRHAESLKNLACLLISIIMLVGLIILANSVGFGTEESKCKCANGQSRTCGTLLAEREKDSLHAQISLEENQYNHIGVAMNGYDPVQFTKMKPIDAGQLGCPEYSANVTTIVSLSPIVRKEEYTFWFISANNRDEFISAPWNFLPRYGGFGVEGLLQETGDGAVGWTSSALGPPSDPPNLWARHNGTLFLFQSKQGHEDFSHNENFRKTTKLLDNLWISWYGSLTAGPFNTHCFAQTWQCCMQCLPPDDSHPDSQFQRVPGARKATTCNSNISTICPISSL